jgi:hypothetical protein
MHRIGVAAWVAAALAIIACAFHEAGAVGIYEDAPAESAFLLSPRQITVRATLEVTSGGVEGSVYRLLAGFPVRSAFFVSVDQPFVALTDSSHITTGLGDLRLRARARLWGGSGRTLCLLGYLGTGTGNSRFFPYSSQTIDVNASAGYADSLGALTVWAIAGFTWIHNYPDNEVVRAAHTDHLRVSAGASLALGSRTAIGVGALILAYERDARRDLLFATGSYQWTGALGLFADVEVETGPVGERVNDWGAIGGASVGF